MVLGPPVHFFDADSDNEYDDNVFFWDLAKGDQRFVIEHLTNKGLPFLHQLLFNNKLDSRSRRETIIQDYYPRPSSLIRALRQNPNPFKTNHQEPPQDRKESSIFPSPKSDANAPTSALSDPDREDPNIAPLAFLWSKQQTPPSSSSSVFSLCPYYAAPCNSDFRSWGYVFWDRRRLEQLLNILPGATCSRAKMESVPPLERQRGNEKSMERRPVEMGLIKHRWAGHTR